MRNKSKYVMFGSALIIIILLVVFGAVMINKLIPSKETMPLTEYYSVEQGEVLIVLQNEIYEKNALLINDKIYVDYDTVKDELNSRFYWDYNENILTFTTPNEILQAEAGNNGYTTTKSVIKTSADMEYPIVKVFADEVYIALDFVQQYSDIQVEFYEGPNRVVIKNAWGDFLFTTVTKKTQLRTESDIKSPILLQLEVGDELRFVDPNEAPQNGFIKVMSNDGVIGYVKANRTEKSYYKTLDSTFEKPEYTSQTRPGKINLVFHQVFNTEAVNNLDYLIGETKGVTVISPTWFSVSDTQGSVTSFASQDYMGKAKNLGLEVWAVADDVNNDVDMYELLSHTSSRENLSNTLIEAALEYKLNGINIDFEKITSNTGEHYIQFLRELSVKCRNNGIVLSVDNYVPTAYTAHYNREEQGVIADYIIVMAYDEYYAGSDVAGPVSSIGFVTDAVTNTLTMVPKEKTIIAIPFYTRLWKQTSDGEISSQSYAMTPAATILADNGVEPIWDNETGCYYAEFTKDGFTYRMWMEEEQSIEEKLKVIYEADVAGIAAWKLGLEKEEIWNVMMRYFN